MSIWILGVFQFPSLVFRLILFQQKNYLYPIKKQCVAKCNCFRQKLNFKTECSLKHQAELMGNIFLIYSYTINAHYVPVICLPHILDKYLHSPQHRLHETAPIVPIVVGSSIRRQYKRIIQEALGAQAFKSHRVCHEADTRQ